jgi:CRP/FNR family transcriptional regulator
LSSHLGERADRLIALLGPGEEFGALSVLDSGPRECTASSVVATQLARLDKASLDRQIAQRPDVTMRMLQLLARQLRQRAADRDDLVFIDVGGRTAKQLLLLARRIGVRERRGVRVELTQVELAELVGASRGIMNKALALFANRGWIRNEPRSVIIVQPERLAERAR